MINWEKELELIFNDPLLADVTAPRKRTTSSDRLIAGFQEILAFYETNGRLPEDTPEEASLFHKWSGLLKSEKKIERCRPYDDHGILPQHVHTVDEPQADYHRELTEEEQLETILNDPLLADIEDGVDLSLFDVPEYMRQRLEARKEVEYIGKRRPCEDFEKYAGLFKEIKKGLKSGKYKLTKFSVKNLKVGSYFVEDGILGYLAAFDDDGVNKHGDRDGRTRVVYENGSEADIKYKTITKNLYVTGYSVIDSSDIIPEEFEKYFTPNVNDVESGTIYVLRSKSTRPEIATIKDLYKIGFTVTSVESRIANAKNEPTYLCADVEVVATWKVYNVKSSTFEALIHKFFAPVQLQVTVDGHRPKEWFIVPFNVIEEAIKFIIVRKPIAYDSDIRQIILLNNDD
ncbi:MAG: GIY-YIG nuclease family protein [Muribaculaceae bacterium]|nr:GIY-YIG nuclease family protein [Muribaculaceae bacterium]